MAIGDQRANLTVVPVGEEIDRHDLGFPPYYDSGGSLGGASILVWGTEEQKQRLLPPIFRGDIVTWQLPTGPEAGSDLAGTQTEAVRDGETGLLVPPGDARALAEALSRTRDDELRARLTAAGRAHVDAHFELDRAAAQVQRAIEEATAPGTRPR